MDLANYSPPIYENNVKKDQTVSLYENSFGDGYNQTTPRGLNHIRKTYTVMIPSMLLSQKDTFEAFFIERGGHKNFTWTVPGDETPRLWKCKEWKINIIAPGYYNCSFKVEEDFALGEDV